MVISNKIHIQERVILSDKKIAKIKMMELGFILQCKM